MPFDKYAQDLAEVDRILNDPETPLDPARVWSLLADISRHARSEPAEETGLAPHGSSGGTAGTPRLPSACTPAA
jgi:hypothetical protein